MQNEPPITQADRELLAAEYEAIKRPGLAAEVHRAPHSIRFWPALRAIAKARQQGREQGLREAAEVCYSKDDHVAILALIDKSGGAV